MRPHDALPTADGARSRRARRPRPGARTSFKVAVGVKVADALSRNKGALPEAFQDGLWCEKYDARLDAAARTWQRSHAQDNLM
jgi:phosphatidylinositol glycan class S